MMGAQSYEGLLWPVVLLVLNQEKGGERGSQCKSMRGDGMG